MPRTIELQDVDGAVRTLERLKFTASLQSSAEAREEYKRLDLILAVLAAMRRHAMNGPLELDEVADAVIRRAPPSTLEAGALGLLEAEAGIPGPLEVGRVSVSQDAETVDLRPQASREVGVIDADFEEMDDRPGVPPFATPSDSAVHARAEGPLPLNPVEAAIHAVALAANDQDQRLAKQAVDETCHWCQVALRDTVTGTPEMADLLARVLMQCAVEARAGYKDAILELARRTGGFERTERRRRDGALIER